MDINKLEKIIGNGTLTMIEAMQIIDANSKGILYIVDEHKHLSGSVTDGDIRRAIIRTGNLDVKISEIMNSNPKKVMLGEECRAKILMKQYQIHSIAVVDADGILVDVIFNTEKDIGISIDNKNILEKVPIVIMAGGKGTRLYPYTKILPKPLIPIGDVPVIERIMERFCDFGVRKFYISVNYKKSMIKSYFAESEHHYELDFVDEPIPLGTAGSLKMLKNQIRKSFIVTNCDILIRADYGDIYNYHKKEKNVLTIVSALKNIEVPYGVIRTKENGCVFSLEEKPKLSYCVNTGMYVLDSQLMDFIPDNTFFHMTDLVDILLQQKQKIGMYPISEDSFLDMGELGEMQRMEQKLNYC